MEIYEQKKSCGICCLSREYGATAETIESSPENER
jgi:hypothetical protein